MDILAERGHQVEASEVVSAGVEAPIGLMDAGHLGLHLGLRLEHLRDRRLLVGGRAHADARAFLVQVVQDGRNRRHFLRGQLLCFFRLLLKGINWFSKLILIFVSHGLF